jgi:hypothetical protein
MQQVHCCKVQSVVVLLVLLALPHRRLCRAPKAGAPHPQERIVSVASCCQGGGACTPHRVPAAKIMLASTQHTRHKIGTDDVAKMLGRGQPTFARVTLPALLTTLLHKLWVAVESVISQPTVYDTFHNFPCQSVSLL